MPSSYELLFSRKPRTMLPRARGRLQSCHPGKETSSKKWTKRSKAEKELWQALQPGKRNTGHYEANLCKGHTKQHG